jgi:hypothetical protein
VTPPRQAESPALGDKAFLILLVSVTLAFAWIVWPFFGAVLWGVILAIVFAPLYRRQLRSMRQRRTLAAFATLVMILVLVILPLTLITALLVQEGAGVYERIQSGEFDIGDRAPRLRSSDPADVLWPLNLAHRTTRISAMVPPGKARARLHCKQKGAGETPALQARVSRYSARAAAKGSRPRASLLRPSLEAYARG